jgi:hypothetical protein
MSGHTPWRDFRHKRSPVSEAEHREAEAALESSSSSSRLLPALWIVLASLLASLIALAILLLVKMDFFSTDALTNEQLKSVWAFLGVALGAVVTLIGTLLTEQHNRRTAALTREAGERERLAKVQQQALAEQAEKRLTIDTVAKTLELITDDSGGYAKRARVGGAIATMVELEGGAVAIRILGELWAADAVDSDTAVWLINRVLKESTETDELDAAADLLVFNAAKLVPGKNDENQERATWLAIIPEYWPQHLPTTARNSLVTATVRLLLVRELEYWHEQSTSPLDLLHMALDDAEHRASAAFVLAKLHDLGVLQALDAEPGEEALDEIVFLSENFTPAPWFARLVAEFERWACGEDVSDLAATTAGSVVAAATGSASSPTAPLADPHTRRATKEPNPSDPA